MVEQPRVTDPHLDQIVLVSQNEMEQWLLKQAKLRYDLEQTRQKVKAKLLECKNSYKIQLEEISRQKELDIQDLQKRYNDLARQKEIQERQNRQATTKLERYHFEEVKELEELYQKKQTLEAESYLRLEQEGLSISIRFYQNSTLFYFSFFIFVFICN